MNLKTSRKAFISILDIREHMSGVEMSAANRSNILENVLGLQVVYLTINYNTSLYSNVALNKRLKRLSPNASVINIYDYYQRVVGTQSIDILSPDKLPLRSIEISGKKDRRLYNHKGEFIGFCKSRNDNSTIEFVNHLHRGIITRREFYDVRGFLSRSDSISKIGDDESIIETYFTIAGTPAIVKRVSVKEKKANVDFIELFDEHGKLIETFANESDFVNFWIEQVVRDNPDDYYIIDRCTEFAEPIIKAVRNNKGSGKTIPVIHNVHTGGDVFDGPVSPFYKSVLEHVNDYSAIISLTNEQKEDMEDRFGTANYYTIPHSYFEVPHVSKFEERDRFKVVYLARYDVPHKQQDIALKAFRLVVDALPMAQLHFHGFGADREKIVKIVNDMNLQNNVKVNDFAPDISVPYKDAGLSILTSRVEAFCMSVMESLFHGCPVVSFDMKYGPSSMIKNGHNGFLVEPNNVEEMANKIIQILSDEVLHRNIVSNAAPSVINLTHDAVGAQWERLFNSIS